MPKNEVVYYYNQNVGNYHYGRNHPMKPQRLQVCNDLIVSYGLDKKLKIVESPKLEPEDLLQFHTNEYVDFLRRASKNDTDMESELSNFNIGDDCPIFEGMYDYCTLYAGGSVEGARRLNHKLNDIVINWPGGLHHAKKAEASGFCYVNDIVLGILELLKYHKRVLYIDIDIHHGDGVQEAFNHTDRVMTVSFHRYGNFFPGTGSLYDRGAEAGRYFAVNVPLLEGADDGNYQSVFEPVISAVMENFQPEAIVLQCGSDSLGEDRLGSFNLSFEGHGNCVRFVKSFGIPMLVVGGGGYTLRNVARCWAYETSICLDCELSDEIPTNSIYYEFFAPNYQLKPPLKVRHINQNNEQYLSMIRKDILESLRMIQGSPSVQMGPIPGVRMEEIEMIENTDRKERKRRKRNREANVEVELTETEGELTECEDVEEPQKKENEVARLGRRTTRVDYMNEVLVDDDPNLKEQFPAAAKIAPKF
ncbi:unnamed protein product [Caenorhabditis bovis]|uniref:Histone deacetylase n=1 Tax=Caenorhabditis bovis TaxID=2654633 RepID=A0A8S1EVH0_9PELO|nr:unnamed protein product [Caenorhabditis bovis]